MAPTKYLQRHDNLCKYIHTLLLQKYGFTEELVKWYEHHPNNIEENEHIKILWNFPVQTDHEIRHHKPDIILINKLTRTAAIIDIAVPNDYNIARKRLDKLRAYTDLSVEIKTLWNLTKVQIIPIIIEASGTFYNGFDGDIKKLSLEQKLNKKKHRR